eukprot:7259683-Pyramimonas_sp.AAC.1
MLLSMLSSMLSVLSSMLLSLMMLSVLMFSSMSSSSGQMETAREEAEGEFRRRNAAERQLAESAAVFKRELWMKHEEISRLQAMTQCYRPTHPFCD